MCPNPVRPSQAWNASTVGDHDIWRLPQEDDTYGGENPLYRFIRHRPVFRAGPPGSPVSPNLAGRDAAAFALCFQVFASSRPELASRCLLAGEHIFELADTDPQGHLLTAIPFDFYPETEWRDDLELGATELALALSSGAQLPGGLSHSQSGYYLEQAAHWASAYIARNRSEGEGLNLYDVSGVAHFELVRTLRQAGNPSGLAVSEGQLIANLAAKLEAAVAQSQHDPFGFGFPWDEADSASHGIVSFSATSACCSRKTFAETLFVSCSAIGGMSSTTPTGIAPPRRTRCSHTVPRSTLLWPHW